MSRYETFEDWLEDFRVYEMNPNDQQFLRAFQTRTQNSTKAIKNRVQEFLQNQAMESNPMGVFEQVMKEVGPGFFLVINNPENPWFEV